MNEERRMPGSDQAQYPSDKRMTLLSLFQEEGLEKLLWQLASATDLAVALADFRGDECTDCINYAEFCRFAREDHGQGPLCTASNATNAFGITQAAVSKKPFIYFCPYGLLMFAIPIIVNDEYLGGFVGGQVRCHDAPADTVRLENVLPCKKDFLDDDETRAYYEQANLLSYDKFVNVAALMESYIRQMTEKRRDNVTNEELAKARQALEDEHKKRLEAEQKSSKYKLTAMRTQFKPYFIMSTLNAISNLAIIENAVQTNELINRFARFMSDLFQKNVDVISLEEEMAMIDSYLAIYKSWMEDKLSYRIDLEGEIRRQKIPAMLVFPIVEQSILHLAVHGQRDGQIHISASFDKKNVKIQLRDNRPPAAQDENSRLILKEIEDMHNSSVKTGLDLTRERMEDYFHGKYVFTTETTDDGETVYMLEYPRMFEREYI